MFETYPKRLLGNRRNIEILPQKIRRFQNKKTDIFSLSKFLRNIKSRKWKVLERKKRKAFRD